MQVGRGVVTGSSLVRGLVRSGMYVALATVLAGCGTTGRTFDTSAMNQVIPGQTTLEQASVLLKSDPENVYRRRDGSAMARWAHKATVLTDAIYFRRELWLQFGSDGRFQHVVDRINVLAEPGQATAPSRAGVPASPGTAVSASSPYAGSAAVTPTDQVGGSLPSSVPSNFPYSTEAFHGPTAVYPVR